MHQSRLPLSEMFRFGVVGVGNTLLNFTTFALVASRLSSLGKGGLILANTLAFGVAVTHSYYWNRRWTFRRAGSPVRFLAINVMGLQLDSLTLAILSGLGLPVALAKAASAGVAALWNYLGSRWVAFPCHSREGLAALFNLTPLTPKQRQALEEHRNSTLSKIMDDLCQN